ncbi:MAG: fasciclin domain-containing protein [Prevotella sp.]|nr:fasciclin domain-containing protein [Prevotella sp.]
MITIKTKRILKGASFILYSLCLGLVLTACTDTWDDHYEGEADSVQGESLWQAIKQNSNLSNFASVVEACGYDKALGSSQVFTVFAPTNTNFSAEEAQELIQAYKEEKGKVSDEDNTVIKEFLQNHIALYNYSVAPNSSDSLLLMNGKRIALSPTKVGNTGIVSSNQLYENGVLFVVDNKMEYAPNIFEYLRMDEELDSVRSFFYNGHFYRRVFQPSESVAGGIEDGQTVYLDSVFRQENELFGGAFLSARLTQEDSTYWMVAPTNTLWKKLVDEYTPYFNYDKTVDYRDSLVYTNPRMAIMDGTIFSRTVNSDAALQDSAMSTSAVRTTWRESYWGAPFMHYYQFGDGTGYSQQKPLQPGGVLADTRNVACSNGQVMKADNQWNFNPLNTFYKTIVVPITSRGVIKIESTTQLTSTTQSESVKPISYSVQADNEFYRKLWGNSFVEFEPLNVLMNHTVRFYITGVLSNIGYDVYLVGAPAQAADSMATEAQRLPTKIRCTMCYHKEDGSRDSTVLQSTQETTPDVVDYMLLAEDFKFPCCSYGLEESEPQVSLKVETRVSSNEYRRNTFSRTMRFSAILLVPHGIARLDEDTESFLISPHGDGVGYRIPIK